MRANFHGIWGVFGAFKNPRFLEKKRGFELKYVNTAVIIFVISELVKNIKKAHIFLRGNYLWHLFIFDFNEQWRL